MKKTIKNVVLLSALCGVTVHATTFEFRSPLSFNNRGYMHWLLTPVDKSWWYDLLPSEKNHTLWNTHAWGAAYTRVADKAFFNRCEPCDNKVTRQTAPLSTLFFLKDAFRGEDVFPGGTFAGAPSPVQEQVNSVNPFLAFARIAPRFQYSEQGANIGVDFSRRVGASDRFHVGGRANIYFKVIEIEPEDDVVFEEGLDDVFVTRIVNTDANANPDQVEYAMRYDFLSSLVFNTSASPSAVFTPAPVVRYNNPGLATETVDIAGVRVSAATADGNGTGVPAAYAVKSVSGALPAVPFRKQPIEVVGALGSGGEAVDGSTTFFQDGVNYANNLANDRAAQGTLFVVPRSNANGILPQESQNILTFIQNLITEDLLISEPASAFFLNNGIDLAEFTRVVGVGDLATEIYGGWSDYDSAYYVDGIIGLQFPTGKRAKCVNRIFYQPTGNNGHVELKLGIDGGWRPREWFAFEIEAFYFHAFKRNEHRAAPFRGQTVISIGPEVDAKVSWNYFVLRPTLNFFHPQNPDLGLALGYELFVKGHDKVKMCQTTATDLLGRVNQPLDPEILERRTNSLSNKVRAEIFHRWNYFELFGGGSQIVSGRNVMKETEGHIGFVAYF